MPSAPQGVHQTGSSPLALRDVASGRRWTFGQLDAAAETFPAATVRVVYPHGHSALFIIEVLGAGPGGKVVCPLEPDTAPPAIPPPPAWCVHLKTTFATTGGARLRLALSPIRWFADFPFHACHRAPHPLILSLVKPTPQPHPQPRTLADLLANAEHYARFCMGNSGRVTPALIFLGPDGQGMFVPTSLADEDAKDDFATMARLTCIAQAASACVMVLEAWAKFARPNEKLDTTEAPSEAFDRQEFVILMGESRDGNHQRFLPIIRSGNGKFFGFGDPYEPGADMQGRFAGLLPPKAPDAAARTLAKVMIQVHTGQVCPSSASRLPRSRR